MHAIKTPANKKNQSTVGMFAFLFREVLNCVLNVLQHKFGKETSNKEITFWILLFAFFLQQLHC